MAGEVYRMEYLPEGNAPLLLGGRGTGSIQRSLFAKSSPHFLASRRKRSSEGVKFVTVKLACGSPFVSKEQESDAACRQDATVIWKNVVAAATAGCVLTLSTFPLATIKTHMQAGFGTTFLGSVAELFKRGGVAAFYSGVKMDLLQNLPYSALYVTTFESLKAVGLPRPVAAAAGSAAACVIAVPADIVTQRMQVGLHPSILDATRSIVQKNGLRGLYAGLMPAFMRILPTAAIQWTVFENLKELVVAKKGGRPLESHENLVLGGIAGSCAALFTCPIEVVKTRLQTGTGYKTMQQALARIVAEEGGGAVFRGLIPRLLMVFPTTAIFFCVYELMKQRLYATASLQQGEQEKGTASGAGDWRSLRKAILKESAVGELLDEESMMYAEGVPPLSLPLERRRPIMAMARIANLRGEMTRTRI